MTLYFVEHSDPYLQTFYLFTAEEKPGYGDYYLCFGIDRKTLTIKDYNNETGIQIHKRFVKRLRSMDKDEYEDDIDWEAMFGGNLKMYKRFEWSIKTIRKQLGA